MFPKNKPNKLRELMKNAIIEESYLNYAINCSCFILVLEDFFYSFSLFEPIFLSQVPMHLIFYVFTFPQQLLMGIYPYRKNFIIFISITIYLLMMKSYCICG